MVSALSIWRTWLVQVQVKEARLYSLGKCPPAFFGASLIALNKEGSGVTVGCTIHRSVAKCAINTVKDSLRTLHFGSISPGFWRHQVCCMLIWRTNYNALIKLGFQSAFNTLRRDKVFSSVKALAPELLPLLQIFEPKPHWGYLHNTWLIAYRYQVFLHWPQYWKQDSFIESLGW